MKKLLFTVLLVLPLTLPFCAAAYEINGVGLGGNELSVRKTYPSARCKPLEWKSDAADRRCDDAKIAFAGGVQARVTFYLNRNSIQAFDVRFDTREVERVAGFLKKSYGAPMAETRDTLESKDKKSTRVLYKVRWEKGKDYAVLFSEKDKGRSSLLASRGDFEEEIYRVR